MHRKDEIKSAYRSLGKAHSFYDGMMTGSTKLGMAVVKMVWQMDREDMLEYQAGAFEPIPADFSGKLLEVPVGTGVLSMPVWKTLPAFIGFWLGVLFLLILDNVIPHLHINAEQAEGPGSHLARTTMMALDIALG